MYKMLVEENIEGTKVTFLKRLIYDEKYELSPIVWSEKKN